MTLARSPGFLFPTDLAAKLEFGRPLYDVFKFQYFCFNHKKINIYRNFYCFMQKSLNICILQSNLNN